MTAFSQLDLVDTFTSGSAAAAAFDMPAGSAKLPSGNTNGLAGKAAPTASSEAARLFDELCRLRALVVQDGQEIYRRMTDGAEQAPQRPGSFNLACYIALRRHDIRDLQRRLMRHGLSSLGRLEGRVLPTMDAVITALAALAGRPSPVEPPTEPLFFSGENALQEESDRLFGPPPPHRRGRIMVTLPTHAADDPDFVLGLARHGMDVARINCAHDDAAAWARMADHVRQAGEVVGRRLTVLMDIAGPKIRTETVAVPHKGARLLTGDRFLLVAEGAPRPTPAVPFSAVVSLPRLVTRLRIGDRVRYDDGKMEGVVDALDEGEALIQVTRTRARGTKLKAAKGLNFPDTALGLSPLTAKDEAALDVVIAHADMIGYSFVADADDIDLLEAALAKRGLGDRALGLVAKIERPEAIRNLPELIARAAAKRPFGVMIARGDLAAEIGFERLAEMQEELLWLCEAAHVPVVWATQVLEDLVKDGIPSRGEMTDAAMAARAECVMLNKGPEVVRAVDLLDRLLARMGEHVLKKTAMLRALRSW